MLDRTSSSRTESHNYVEYFRTVVVVVNINWSRSETDEIALKRDCTEEETLSMTREHHHHWQRRRQQQPTKQQ